jgi:hypothetical protein
VTPEEKAARFWITDPYLRAELIRLYRIGEAKRG